MKLWEARFVTIDTNGGVMGPGPEHDGSRLLAGMGFAARFRGDSCCNAVRLRLGGSLASS